MNMPASRRGQNANKPSFPRKSARRHFSSVWCFVAPAHWRAPLCGLCVSLRPLR